jgi:hypothetical protein
LVVYFIEKAAPSALFALLFHHSPVVIGFALEHLLRSNVHTQETKLEIVEFGLIRFEQAHSLPLRPIAKFFVEMLRSGGLEVLATLLLKRKQIAIALLSEQIVRAIFVLALNDPPNTNTFLQFVQLIMSVIREDPLGVRFSKPAFRCALLGMLKHGRDPQRGPAVVATAAQLMNDARALLGRGFESLFRTLSAAEQADACEILRTQIGKAALRKKNAHLIAFSDGPRLRKTVDEWQTLEIDGSGDD